MKKRKIIFLAILFWTVGVLLFFNNTYTSSPGYVTQEWYEEFDQMKPYCFWYSILLNKKQTWVDAPGRSLCIWYLKKK